ncbi:MAG TPA: ABC transporter substrate-binding protein [Thermomicrobiales bacterium]|nr:ABC transporter substrate-binding protein [Thermomicrobiales bacterium]
MGRTSRELADENFARWQWFYKKGMIDRRTFVKATMAWSGAAAMGGSLLAACGGDDDDDDSGSGGAATTASGGATTVSGTGAQPTATTAAGAAPTSGGGGGTTEGGTLRVALQTSENQGMDPHMHNQRTGIIFFYHTHDNLGVRDMSTMQIGPWLAESWEVTDPTTWNMKLRQDVKFHNGDPFTAETVKWNWERVINPEQKSQQAGNHAQIAGVDIVDEYTVNVRTKVPYPIFTERLQNFQMIPEKLAQEKGDAWLAENPVGSGPYKLVEWKKGSEYVLTRNDDYWNKDVTIAYKDLILRTMPELSTQLAELLAGGLDIIRVVPFDQMKVVTDSGVATPKVQDILRVQFVVLDAKGRGTPDNPFTDVRVRNAANHAIDVQTYIDTLQAGGDRTPALVNPKHFGFDPSIVPHEYDPEKAKALLKEAGYEDGFDVKWKTGPQLMPNATQVEQAMQRDLAAVGINAEFEIVADGSVSSQQTNEGKNPPMASTSWGSYSVFDADGILWDMLHSTSIFSYYENKEFDALIDEARGILDSDKRKELYSSAQKILREEAPMLFMWGLHTVWGVNNDVDWTPAPDEIDRYFWAKPKA